MELNPNNPVLRDAHGNWHKIAALVMIKLGLTELRLNIDDVMKIAAGNINVVLDAKNPDYLLVRIVDDKTADELARRAGGRAQDS